MSVNCCLSLNNNAMMDWRPVLQRLTQVRCDWLLFPYVDNEIRWQSSWLVYTASRGTYLPSEASPHDFTSFESMWVIIFGGDVFVYRRWGAVLVWGQGDFLVLLIYLFVYLFIFLLLYLANAALSAGQVDSFFFFPQFSFFSHTNKH